MIIASSLLALQLTAVPVAQPYTAPLSEPGYQVAGGNRNAALNPLWKSLYKELQLALGVQTLGKGFGVSKIETSTLSVCNTVATLAARAGIHEAEEDLFLNIANCLNMVDSESQAECMEEIWEEYLDTLDEIADVYDARNELCALTGEELYDPEIDPEDFVSPEDVGEGEGNEYYPMEVGMTWIYQKVTDEEIENIVVTVEDDVRTILGVDCFVVRDTVSVIELEDGAEGDLDETLVEDTFDYYALDVEGNVWYFGEDTWELEDGVIVSTEGRWISGEDFAKPGIVMHAVATVGQTYRQEFQLDEAEDAATMVSVNASVDVAYTPAEGTFENCRQTEDFTPIEPGVSEFKYYAPGIGLVLETDPEDPDERLELIDFFIAEGGDDED